MYVFINHYREDINCSIAGLDEFSKNETVLKECTDKNLATKVAIRLSEQSFVYLKSQQNHECLMSCTQTSYGFHLRFFHKNSLMNPDNHDITPDIRSFEPNAFLLVLSYQSFLVEEKIENLVYDFSSFVSAAGGNLGLFLGLSLFSALQMCLQFVKNKGLF